MIPLLPLRFGRTAKLLLTFSLAVATVTAGVWTLGRRDARADLSTTLVRYEKITPTLVTRGDLSAIDNSDIVCRVRSWDRGSTFSTFIKWIVADGVQVRRGDLLVELDDSALREDLQVRRVPLEQAWNDWAQSEANHRIVVSQNHDDIEKAAVAVRLAELDVQKYRHGDYEQARKDVEGRLSMAEGDLDLWLDRAAWTERMARRGYLSATQLQGERLRLRNSRLSVDKLQEEQRVLQRFTRVRTLTELEHQLGTARHGLEKAKIQARARELQAEVDRLTKHRIYERRRSRYDEVEAEIPKCLLTAPHDGLVIYSLPEQARSGAGAQAAIIAPGEPVREGQRLLRLPDLSRMQVTVSVHEALVARLRGESWRPTGFAERLLAAQLAAPDLLARLGGFAAFDALRHQFREQDRLLVYGGQKALVRLDAFPNRPLRGHVRQVANVATIEDWRLDVRTYQVQVVIDEMIEGLRPDMNAEVTIFSEEATSSVLAVPVRAILHSPADGNHGTCFVLTPEGPEEREVVVGTSNEELAEIQRGLQEGEEVVLNPEALMHEE